MRASRSSTSCRRAALPDTRSTRAANVCRIAVHRPEGGDIAVVLAVEDNLVKGAAGQAIQNMNLMFGLARDDGPDCAAGAAVAMAFPASWRRARQFFRHFRIDAPRMAVRSHLPWPWRGRRRRRAGRDRRRHVVVGLRLRPDLRRVQPEGDRGEDRDARGRQRPPARRNRRAAGEEFAAGERARDDAGRRRPRCQSRRWSFPNENSQLKEELAFLQKLVADSNKQTGLSIQRLEVERESDDACHYRLLIVRGGNPQRRLRRPGHVAGDASCRSQRAAAPLGRRS